MNVAAKINELEAMAEVAEKNLAMIKAFCQQARKIAAGVSTPAKRRKKGSLSDKEKVDIVAKSRARRKIA